MGLDDTQIKFLEEFILRRKIRLLGTDHDPARDDDPKPAAAVDPDDIHRVSAAAARLRTPEGALPEDVAALSAHRAAVSGFLDDPVTERDLRSAAIEVKAMAETHAAATRRAKDDAERRRGLAADLVQTVRDTIAALREDVPEAEASDLSARVQAIDESISGTPPDTALDAARESIEQLSRDVTQANERAQQDRKERAAEKASVLQKLAALAAIDDGTLAEQERRTTLVSAVTAACAADAPPRPELAKAAQAISDLSDHVGAVRKDIDLVRRPRFEKAQAEHEALQQISLDMPEGCPEDEQAKLAAERKELADLLAPRLDWARVTEWDAEDLIDINERRDRLAREADDLRDRVSKAAEALRQARDGAQTAMTPPSGGGFSEAQIAQMQEMFRTASEAAAVNLLKATEPVAALKKLARHAARTAKLRQSALQRIGALPDKPPAGATQAQQAEWTRLRTKALNVADEVLDP